MRKGVTSQPVPPRRPADALRRSRWPVLFCALLLLWCVWWYCRDAGLGLLYFAAGVAAIAVARPRALPGTARWIIWSGLLLTVLCLAANVARLMPPENALGESRAIDRVITIVFALGLTSLFFRPSVDGVTLAAVGGLPMAMVVLAREAGAAGGAGDYLVLIIWGLVVLLIAADLAERLTRKGAADGPVSGTKELFRRLLFLGTVVALAFGLRVPVEGIARGVQKRLFGLMIAAERQSRMRGDLLLARQAPVNFGRRMRVVLLVGAEKMPGYLRESVFLRYHAGRWTVVKPALPLQAHAEAVSGSEGGGYRLRADPPPAVRSAWRVEVFSPALLENFCLPGNAVALACDGLPPFAETNGTIAANGVFPDVYSLQVVPGRLIESAYPLPDGLGDPAYLEVPSPLAGAVSNWVAGCAGLAEAPTLPVAIRRVEEHFATNFAYRLGVHLRADRDPLVDFMGRKEGSCTLFASAAALMFRHRGIPSRVVGGYVCSNWNPWLGRWVVRERDGHTWVEVWDRATRRWLVADPTPPAGNPASLNRPGKLRMVMDLWIAGWKRLLAYLRNTDLLVVIADAGATLCLFVWHTLWSLPGLVVLAGFGAVGWLRRRARRRRLTPGERLRSELVAAMKELERRSVDAPLRRRSFESWSAWLKRVGPELPPERFNTLRDGLELYQTLRYSLTLDEPAARDWLASVRRMRR